ncbi:canalicular multispecific organic anion transporter, partial [Thraustotheca clavata]
STKPQTSQELPQKDDTQTLIAQEERIEGAVRLQTYTTYFGSSGWNVAGDIYLGHWSSTPSLLSSISAGGIYGGIMGVALLLVCARSLFVLYIAQSCSLHFHDRLFRKVLSLSVPLFFDVTPVGRILNRFSNDLDTLDSQIPFYGYLLLQFIFQILALIIVCGITTPYVLIAYPLMFYCFYKLQTYFNPTSGALKRMESITRSPLVTLVSETLSGLATIRAFKLNSEFIKWNRDRLDRHMQFFSTFYLSRCWFQMRLDWMSASIIIVVAFV